MTKKELMLLLINKPDDTIIVTPMRGNNLMFRQAELLLSQLDESKYVNGVYVYPEKKGSTDVIIIE